MKMSGSVKKVTIGMKVLCRRLPCSFFLLLRAFTTLFKLSYTSVEMSVLWMCLEVSVLENYM